MSCKGDDYLSGVDLKLWGIVHYILVTWNTLVIFKHKQYSVPAQMPGLIEFFVPSDSVDKDKIREFLEVELASLKQEPYELLDLNYKHPGVNVYVRVHEFTGVEPYLPDEVVRRISEKAVSRLKEELDRMMKKEGRDKKGVH